MKVIIFCVLILYMISPFCLNSKDKKYYIYDSRNFNGTNYEKIIASVKLQDTSELNHYFLNDTFDINFQEPNYGRTILHLAVEHNYDKSIEHLLKLGADPNIYDNSGENAVHLASKPSLDYSENLKALDLVLSYGGDPNSITKYDRDCQTSPLMLAAMLYYKKSMLLIEKGADIHFRNGCGKSILYVASSHASEEQLLILKYILENGVDYKQILNISLDGDTLRLENALRNCIYPLDTKRYKIKMDIVEFLKQKGIDYRATPIPERILEKYDKEYLEKY